MAAEFQINQVVLTLLQVVALLFPVVILTMRYLLEHESGQISEKRRNKIGIIFLSLIFLLSISGFTSSASIIFRSYERTLVEISVLSLMAVFLLYGYSIFLVARSGPDQ